MRLVKSLVKLLLVIAAIGAFVFWQRDPIGDLIDSTKMPCEEKIYEALMDYRENFYLIGYDLEDQELFEIWCDVAYTEADLFFVADEYHFTMLGDKVLAVQPIYTMTEQELAEARQMYAAALEKLRSFYDPDWNQLETALFYHDYLCMCYGYDESLSRYSAYELLTEGIGVCQSYALLYAELMNGFGIECDYVISSEMNHMWNVVTIDGVKYNVDVTYDDPTSDRRGRASHTYFLRSDAGLTDHSFTAEEGYGQCTDTRYDEGAVWDGVRSGFVPVDGSFFFIKSGMLYRWDGGEPQYIDTIFATWFTGLGNDSYWKGNHSTLWFHDGLVLYSKPKQILSYAPATGIFVNRYQYSGSEDIYGFSYIDGELVLQIGTSPNEPGRLIVAEEGLKTDT
ncbi:MAG: hypothetical protein IJD81_07285 [Oscillospiraceae bacterium]|nr:hypothetical protein [Oscillospiraceae bacterium]